MSTIKEPLSYQKQVEKIIDKGCAITDNNYCTTILKNIGYYRLSVYFLPFTKDKNSTLDFSFSNVCSLYEFDRELRNLLFEFIEVIEIKARTVFAHYHAFKYSPLGYKHSDSFNSYFKRTKFDELINIQIENNKKRLFVKHHIEKYEEVFPIWVLMELFTLGMLSKFYSDIEIRKKIENKQNYIRQFKTNNKTIKCRYCNHEVKSESIIDETGTYHCYNCNYSIKIPIPKF